MPFVDVLNSMLNPDLPLTVTEYDEWGQPAGAEVHARIAAYAPYENVRAQDYPHLLVVAGYNDSRVRYWKPQVGGETAGDQDRRQPAVAQDRPRRRPRRHERPATRG